MNVVEISNSKYDRYKHDIDFLKSQFSRYKQWILKYQNDGEVALDYFGVTVDNTGVSFLSKFTLPEKSYGIVMAIPMVNIENKAVYYFPYVIYHISVIDGIAGFCLDMLEDDIWDQLSIKDIHELDDKTISDLNVRAMRFMTIFAEIQTNAFKCRHKIIKEMKKHEYKMSTPSNQATSARSKSKPIILSQGITYSIANTPSIPRRFTRRCEAWGVRGHYRHYKNGKVIYVRPYKKGNGKTKITTYKVEEDND